MNRTTPRPLQALLAVSALASALMGAFALLSWRGLTESTAHTAPILATALLVGLTSGVSRALGAPTALAWPLGALVGLCSTTWLATGSFLPTPGALSGLVREVDSDLEAIRAYAVPITAEAGALEVSFTLVALLVVLLLDLVVVSRGWVLLGGFIALVVHLVPANLRADTDWRQFVPLAVTFVVLLALARARELGRWQPARAEAGVAGPVDHPTPEPRRPRGPAFATSASSTAVAVVLACILAALPLASRALWDRGGSGSGAEDQVTIANPLVDLRRDLDRGSDIEVLVVNSPEGSPRYLRTAVLTEYDGRQWSTGDRRASPAQRADGPMPQLPGLAPGTSTSSRSYIMDALPGLRSRWLPLPEHAVSVFAEGDWRYDEDTRDFVAWEDGLDTSGLSWEATATVPRLQAEVLDQAARIRPGGGTRWTDLPKDIPEIVPRLAREVTAGADTSFRRARALQSWFRSEFTYSLDRVESVGDDDLVAFLSPDGRVGYCEQFAASMALMARSLGIPARVAVGFLEPDEVTDDTFVFSAHDMHAWPELYFEGAGWVRFEPTPGSRAEDVPTYTRTPLEGEDGRAPTPSAGPSASATTAPSARPSASPGSGQEQPQAQDDAGTDGLGILLGAVVAALVVLLVALAPWFWRRRQRRSRMDSEDPEQWWSEVRAVVVDLGMVWPSGLSPREQGRVVADLAGGGASVRAALDGLVQALEVQRYAAPGSAAGSAARPGSVAGGVGIGAGVGVRAGAGAGDGVADGAGDGALAVHERHAAPDGGPAWVAVVGSGLTGQASRGRRLVARLAPRSLVLRR